MIKLIKILDELLKESLNGDYEYMLYSLYASENKIKQFFPGSKIIKIKDGIKVEFPEPYYVNTLDNHPEDEEEGYGIFNHMIIKVAEWDYSRDGVYTYDIILPAGSINRESVEYISNMNKLYNWLSMMHSVKSWLEQNKNK